MLNFSEQRTTLREDRQSVNRVFGGKLVPVMISQFMPGEGGVIDEDIIIQLEPIAGRMITPINCEVQSVFVPTQAMHALRYPDDETAGLTEVINQKLEDGTPLFGLEEENTLSQHMGVNPRSINGTKKVSETIRLAHNCAVNFLRQRRYTKADILAYNSYVITPAILSATVLDKLNAVLDPDDHVNGVIDFQGQIPVRNIGIKNSPNTYEENDFKTTGGVTSTETVFGTNSGQLDSLAAVEDPDNPGFPKIFADLAGAADISISDLYRARRIDQLTREFAEIVDKNPLYGEQLITRLAHGLSIDTARDPILLRDLKASFSRQIRPAVDTAGVQGDIVSTLDTIAVKVLAPVPTTQLGGCVVTFVSIKPLEILAAQPHPTLTVEFGARNHAADSLNVDPQPVYFRDLDSDVDQADEEERACYVGYNHLRRYYESVGFTRNLDPNEVANKSALWVLDVPNSVSPESVIYPETLEAYPFADSESEIATITVKAKGTIASPIFLGPNPVEALDILDEESIYEND